MNHHQEGHFSAPDGTRLWFERDVPDGARAHAVLVHGYGDHLGRYRTFRDAMLAEHFAMHAYDVRGHGRSEGARGAVRAFSDYTAELEAFVRSSHALAAGLPLFIVAHSHGGLITLRWLANGGAETARTLGLRGLVLSAPYLALAFTPRLEDRARRAPLAHRTGCPSPVASARPTSAAIPPGSGPPTRIRFTAARPRPAGGPSRPRRSTTCWPRERGSGFQCCWMLPGDDRPPPPRCRGSGSRR
jgi:alpha-beta hydrolase superfamily lysophospholipase